MASYEMQELNLPGQEGGRVLFPRMKLCGQMDLDEITRRICSGSTFTPGDVKGLVMALSREIADGMAEGRSVKVDGIGVFTPGLGLRKGFERETGREGERRRNARSICVDRIHFRADKELLRETDRNCYLERSDWKFRKSSTRYTPEERLGLAREFLETHSYLTVSDYAALTGLLRNAAAKELRRWAEDETSGIGRSGRGTHRVYVRRVMPAE